MDSVPVRRPLTVPYRALTNFLERRIRLPDINPSWYQVAAILASLAILYVPSTWAQAALLSFILLSDWLDGATARQHRGHSREGYMMDVTIDRASEVLIFAGAASTLLGKLFFALALLNIGLAYYSIRSGKHTSLPLRCAWLVVVILAGGG
jgi:phosphatidylglycerophosphate synthase